MSKPHLSLILLALCARPLAAAEPAPALQGLWCVNVSGDFSWLSNQDLNAFYAPGRVNVPATQMYPGFALSLRRFGPDRFLASLNLASLPKGYNIDLPAGPDSGPASYEWDAVLASLGVGWLLYQSPSAAFYAQAEAGWIFLSAATFTQMDGRHKGTFEGSALAESVNLGGLWFLLPSVALELQGGYRWARMPVTAFDDKGRYPPVHAPEFFADFSGPFARAGVSFFWGLRNPWGETDETPPAPRVGPPAN